MANEDIDLPYDTQLLNYRDLPQWMKDNENELIFTSYRKPTHSYHLSLKTIWHLHNETVNIWTHLLGTILFLCILLPLFLTYTILAPTIHPSPLDTLFITLYHVGVTTCFFLSSTFHTFSSHSPVTQRSTNTLDHIGIILVIDTSTLSMIHFTFHCSSYHHLRNTYMAISTFLALLCIILTLYPFPLSLHFKPHISKPNLQAENHKIYKWFSHSLLGLSSFLPLLHAFTLYSPTHLQARASALYFTSLALINCAGGVIYILRIPERWIPGKCDTWGGSHAIMHILVVIGAGVWEWGLVRCVEFWGGGGGGLCDGG